jgi:phosphonate ABC transporter permease subunit PhnE
MGRRPSVSGERRSLWRILRVPLLVVLAVVVYSYTFQEADVNLDEIRSETRQTQLVRVLRALARPEVLTYERIETPTDAALALPCGPALPAAEYGPDERQIAVEPSCAEPGAEITVTGTNFSPNARGQIYQVPSSGEIELRLEEFIADENGDFVVVVDTRERPEDVPQTIRVITREPIGSVFSPEYVEVETDDLDEDGNAIVATVRSPRISEAAYNTWDRITETVMMAFLATSVGVLVAVPFSFLAARNIMREVTTTVLRLSLQILVLPVGMVAGIIAARWMQDVPLLLTDSVGLVVGGLIVIPVAIFFAIRRAFPPIDEGLVPRGERAIRVSLAGVAAVASILVLFLLADLLTDLGAWAAPSLARLAFIANFVETLGDILAAIITVITALITTGVAIQLAGRLAAVLRQSLPGGVRKAIAVPLAGLAGGVLAAILAQGVAWLYQLNDPVTTIWIPGAVGAVIGLALAIRSLRKDDIGVGLSLYYVSRTIFNALRSIEPLIMVIVFAVWVGLGPFAGSLALATHTIAALAKLYSEQVESILPGPVEAVKASGATRLQTIAYAVLPQVIPPYISFTLYRWDINVRMSTIIGFGGGGGIGFLLQQNIRLLNYQAASVNMLAIAIVVASMDYLSARIRERIV